MTRLVLISEDMADSHSTSSPYKATDLQFEDLDLDADQLPASTSRYFCLSTSCCMTYFSGEVHICAAKAQGPREGFSRIDLLVFVGAMACQFL